jgi:hypothetical protein
MGPEGVFLDVIGTKISRLLLPSTTGFTPPYRFVGLEISTARAESEWGSGLGFVYINSSFTFESCIVLSLITFNLHY